MCSYQRAPAPCAHSLPTHTRCCVRSPLSQELDEFFDDIHAMAIVITDLESSTAQAQADRAAYKLVQDIHDAIFRECLSEFNGYEINTEGDSFHCAFADMPSAVVFCLEVQQRLLESKWPPSVLRLPACNRVRFVDLVLWEGGPCFVCGGVFLVVCCWSVSCMCLCGATRACLAW